MKRWIWIAGGFLGAAGCALALLTGLYLSLGSRAAAGPAELGEAVFGRPAVSSSGRYLLTVLKGHDPACGEFQQFQIMSNGDEPETLYAPREHFRGRDTTWFLWDDRDRVWVYSGDVGTSYWERAADGTWKKQPFRAGTGPAPVLLRKRRPQIFK